MWGDRVMPDLGLALDPMAPVFIGLGQRVKVGRPGFQVLQWSRLSWQPPERTAQVRKIGNTFDPLTWSVFLRGFSRGVVGFRKRDLP